MNSGNANPPRQPRRSRRHMRQEEIRQRRRARELEILQKFQEDLQSTIESLGGQSNQENMEPGRIAVEENVQIASRDPEGPGLSNTTGQIPRTSVQIVARNFQSSKNDPEPGSKTPNPSGGKRKTRKRKHKRRH